MGRMKEQMMMTTDERTDFVDDFEAGEPLSVNDVLDAEELDAWEIWVLMERGLELLADRELRMRIERRDREEVAA